MRHRTSTWAIGWEIGHVYASVAYTAPRRHHVATWAASAVVTGTVAFGAVRALAGPRCTA